MAAIPTLIAELLLDLSQPILSGFVHLTPIYPGQETLDWLIFSWACMAEHHIDLPVPGCKYLLYPILCFPAGLFVWEPGPAMG